MRMPTARRVPRWPLEPSYGCAADRQIPRHYHTAGRRVVRRSAGEVGVSGLWVVAVTEGTTPNVRVLDEGREKYPGEAGSVRIGEPTFD